MKLKYITNILFMLCCFIVLQACGNGGAGSSNSGTLSDVTQTSTDNTDGTYTVTANATYTPPPSKTIIPNTTISFITQISANGIVQFTVNNSNVPVDGTGKATISPIRIAQSNEPLYVSTTANIGGLSQTAFLTIPLINTVLTPTPSVVTFVQVDPVGGQAPFTIQLSGGFLPYSIVSNDRTSDIDAKLNGSILTITKLVASGTTSTSTFATITLNDRKGTSTSVRVNYFR